ncbi:MAG: hypothetical protein A2808_01945 [Candidatus Moranbacteria bacterium RIFCSPHIGHO2_01_FULL_55_24]|nr:MAG: hypothetical protein A2808_01945 [Candidatus Moranbacteria bacterium RIFCSPHIGHO2_01_FULL_55_24]
MRAVFLRAIHSLENMPISLGSFLAAFFCLIIFRLVIEGAVELFAARPFSYIFFQFIHTLLFFLCSYLLFLPVIERFGKASLSQAANILLFGFLIILTPPLIDTYIFGGAAFWSFYEFDGLKGLFVRYFTLFGDTPEIGITYGVRIEVVIVTLGTALYAFLKSGKVLFGLLAGLTLYSLLFVLGTMPSWLTLAILAFQKNLFAISHTDVAGLFLSPETILSKQIDNLRTVLHIKMSLFYAWFAIILGAALLWRKQRAHFLALFWNARFPQVIYHSGLVFLGAALAWLLERPMLLWNIFDILALLLLAAAAVFAWLASVVANDLYDMRIDAKTNADRPLIVGSIDPVLFRTYGIIFFIASLLFAGIVSFSALLLLLAYQAIAWIYSAPPFRLKRIPVLATLLAAFAGFLVLACGFLAISPSQNLGSLPLPLLFFLIGAYAALLPIKDFKDIAGDRADHVYTLPVLLGEVRAKRLIGSLLFLFFAASPSLLNMQKAFLPSLFFGSLAYWSLQKGTSQKGSLFTYTKIPGVILGIAIFYGFALALLLL